MAKGLILFVHGLGGSAAGSWEKFPELVCADPQFANYDVGFFEYPTTRSPFRLRFWKKYSKIQTLADALRTVIENRYTEHRPIVLVAHSLGGLICRSYLVDAVMSDSPLRVARLVLYATPNSGSGLANVTQYLSWRQPQLKQLCKNSDLIISLNRAWEQLRMSDKIAVRYVVATDDDVVNPASAGHFPGNPEIEVLTGRNHRNCVKPESSGDLAFEILKTFVGEEPAAAPDSVAAGAPYRVIGFDLDGTLIRGLKFSWTLVWEHLGFPEEVYKAGMRRYLHGEFTYAEWCAWAVKMYRSKGLKREDFKAIVKPLRVTNNLREALKILRNDGFTLGLISGGIDVMLYEVIPDADELFDDIFINKLQFDALGVVRGVEATEYDFAGKADALETMCTDRGYTLDHAVFVGEGFNDSHVSAKAGLSIAYPPRAFELEAASHVLIEEDDLMKVVECVIGQ
jgi:HAD superfamily phosphoserine phosphatase-like hydrolase